MSRKHRKRSGTAPFVPDWARDAVWYQVFPERFRNGCPDSSPRLADITDKPVPGWQLSPWGMDWYSRQAWEVEGGDFHKAVHLRRFGGDLVGLREKLDYLQDLGVTAIYLNPVFMAPSLHKYDAACLHHIDPTLGPDREGDLKALRAAHETEDPSTWIWTAADRYFVDLIADIHSRGMRIIIDGVFNHTGCGFFGFQDLLRRGRRSRFKKWYRIKKWKADGSFLWKGWFGFKGLPELARDGKNLAEPVRRYIYAITRRWMDPDADGDPSDGVDGWRLDVAFCVPHGFWKSWRRIVKGINPDAFLCGELVGLAKAYLKGDELDAVMNYAWLYPTICFFAQGSKVITAGKLRESLQAIIDAYPEDVSFSLQNLLDSHDVGRVLTMLENPDIPMWGWDEYFDSSRVMAHPDLKTTCPGSLARDAWRQVVMFQMTYLGAPMIYYGTEVGMWGANDPHNRQPMLWDDIKYERETHAISGECPPSSRGPNKELFGFYRRAIRLRRRHEVFRRGSLEWLDTGNEHLLGFVRRLGSVEVAVLFNASDKSINWDLSASGVDLWQTGEPEVSGRVEIGPRGWRVLRLCAP